MALILAAILICAGCKETTEAAENVETTTTTVTATETTTIVTETEATTTAETTTTTTTTTTTVTTTEEPEITVDLENYDYASFDINDYYPADETAEPLEIRYKKGVILKDISDETEITVETGEEKLVLAKQAVMDSEYYASVVEQAKEIFSFENGEYNLSVEEAPFYADGYEGYLDSEEAYCVNPRLVYADSDCFSENETGYIFIFKIPLPMNYMEWSGKNHFYITVYVNQQDEAVLIPEFCSQTLIKLESMCVGDSVHILANTGHSSGTACSTIISFGDGGYKVEYTGIYIEYNQNGTNYILDDMTGGDTGWYQMLCYDKEKGYTEVASQKLSGEAMEIICSCPAVLEAFPDIRSDCESGYVYTIGGYISNMSRYVTFSLKDGMLCLVEGFVSTSGPDSIAIIAENY